MIWKIGKKYTVTKYFIVEAYSCDEALEKTDYGEWAASGEEDWDDDDLVDEDPIIHRGITKNGDNARFLVDVHDWEAY